MQARRRRDPNAFQLRASLHDQFARVRMGAISSEHCETLRRLPSAEREPAYRFAPSGLRRPAHPRPKREGEMLSSPRGKCHSPPEKRRRRVSLEGRWAMIELILTVCALNAPTQCEEQRLQFVSQGSLMQCMMQAPPYIAAWSEEHPATPRRAMAMRLPRERRPEDLIARLRRAMRQASSGAKQTGDAIR